MASRRGASLGVGAIAWTALWLAACAGGSSGGGSSGGGGDAVAPTIVGRSPAAGALDVVPAGLAVTATFSEAMDPTTINAATFVLRDGGGALVPGAVGYLANVATFTPAVQLAAQTTYTATISTGAKDVAGNPLAPAVSWSFTTQAEPDTTGPSVGPCLPASGAVGVALDTALTVTFSEAMDPASTAAAFSLSGPGGTPVVASVTVVGATATLTPAAPLAELTTYTASVSTAAQDLHGNPLALAVAWSFTTADVTSPTVTSADPAPLAANVDVGSWIRVSFSETVAASSLDASTFQLLDGLGTPVPGALQYGGNAAYLTPSAPLAGGTTYTISATSGITDTAGNPLAAYASTFTTTGPGTGSWSAMAAASALDPYAARADPSAVWTGTELVVWGGWYQGPLGQVYVLATGGRYSPSANAWVAISSNLANTPGGRFGHATAWTGTRMVVWGGRTVGGLTATGGVFDPSAGTWTPTKTTGAPAARADPAAVWTGAELIVWGGWEPTGFDAYFGDGARYAPASDSWTTMSATGAPSPRVFAASAWTGSRLLVWGGLGGIGALGDGASYDPATDTWTPLAAGGPSPRWKAAAVWTGARLIVWGGEDAAGPLGDGAAYDPATDTWSAIAADGAPPPRGRASAVWTGSRMIVWGGEGTNPPETRTGGVYDPAADAWSLTALAGAPAARRQAAAVWTGTQLLVWGGWGASILADGARFTP